jgi:hypothetical protein
MSLRRLEAWTNPVRMTCVSFEQLWICSGCVRVVRTRYLLFPSVRVCVRLELDVFGSKQLLCASCFLLLSSCAVDWVLLNSVYEFGTVTASLMYG